MSLNQIRKSAIGVLIILVFALGFRLHSNAFKYHEFQEITALNSFRMKLALIHIQRGEIDQAEALCAESVRDIMLRVATRQIEARDLDYFIEVSSNDADIFMLSDSEKHMINMYIKSLGNE